MLPCFIAAPISYTVYAYFFGWDPIFAMPECSYENALRLLPYFVLALIVTFGARFYISFFRGTERGIGHCAGQRTAGPCTEHCIYGDRHLCQTHAADHLRRIPRGAL